MPDRDIATFTHRYESYLYKLHDVVITCPYPPRYIFGCIYLDVLFLEIVNALYFFTVKVPSQAYLQKCKKCYENRVKMLSLGKSLKEHVASPSVLDWNMACTKGESPRLCSQL